MELNLKGGIFQAVKDYKPAVIEYNPDKFWEENTIESIFKDLQEYQEKERKWKKETGWKPQYMISVGETKTANLFHLQWLCKNYNVIGGSESCRTLKQREIIIPYTKKSINAKQL